MWIMTPTWLNLPIIDSRVSFEHPPDFMVSFMSLSQSSVFSGVKDNVILLVSISQPKITFCSDSWPSAKCFVMEMMDFLGVASSLCIGRVTASSANGTEWMIRCCVSPKSTPAWKISSMKLSVTMSLGGNFTARSSASAKAIFAGRYLGGRLRNSKSAHNFVVSQVGSAARSWATSVTVSLMSPNIDGAGVEPKGRRSSK